MPIGLDPGTWGRIIGPRPGLPSGQPPPPAVRPPTQPMRSTAHLPAPDPVRPPTILPAWEPTARVDKTPELEVVVWTVWRTTGDERVCPVCGPLDGQEGPADAGPQPPAHPNCRCERVVSRVELRVRG